MKKKRESTYNGKANLVPFKKGDDRINRNGAPRKNPSVKMVVDALHKSGIKKVTRQDAESLVFTLLNMTVDELAIIAQGRILIEITPETENSPAVYEETAAPYLAQAVAMDILGANTKSRTMSNLIDDMRQSSMMIQPQGNDVNTPLIVKIKG